MSYVDPHLILQRLSPRDLAILDDIERFRLLTTRLIQRLHFPVAEGAHASSSSATKQAMRVLRRLTEHGVLMHLERRIGGHRHGSQGFIWQLASTGANVQRIRRGESTRRRYVEPSAQFTNHTLAIAELATTLHELARTKRLDLLRLEAEPDCWRTSLGPHGIPQTLKPDLYAVTATAEYEDSWFLEADLDTEHMPQILAKCRAYATYHAAGIEQHDHGVFPAVLWVTSNEARAEKLRRTIQGERSLPQRLFTVITTHEFSDHLTAVGEPPPANSSVADNQQNRKED